MLYRSFAKKSILLFLIAGIFSVGIAFGEKPQNEKILHKYEKWKIAVSNPSNSKNVFSFFFNNPHWPLFEKSVKIAEEHISDDVSDFMILSWFGRYSPKTGSGLKAYMKCLIRNNPDKAEEYIKQTWIFQNLSPEFIKDYKSEFDNYITSIDDAKKAKRLILQNRIEQLKALKNLVISEISQYISNFLSKLSKSPKTDIDKKYDKLQRLIESGKDKEAASILASSNDGEEKYETSFFNQRRRVAFNILRSGNFELAYKVMSLYNIKSQDEKNEKIAKAEWLLGYISYRFLKDNQKAIAHFKKAYENSLNSIRLSKNAFWLANVFYSQGDVILAFDWFKKAEKFFSTFYGYLAKEGINYISKNHFHIIDNQPICIPESREIIFYNRELVQVLLNIRDKTMSKHFYSQLINEIEDPNEEALLMDLATLNDDIALLISENSKRQHYFQNDKAYKILNAQDMKYVKKINSNACFVSLVHSVIHRESNFNKNAKSPAGAVGLMQIMPATAKFEAKRIKFYTKASLFDKQKNITIGSAILNRLLKKYQNNLVYVAAAYNCGEGNVAKYQRSIKNLGVLNTLDLIELIPIKETRIYVKHVMRAMFTYQKRFLANDCYNCRDILNLIR